MAARLGNVLYWLGCAASIPFAAYAIWAGLASIGYFGGSTAPGETQAFALMMVVYAAGCWVSGRALRYILAGT
jgi:hypothetical protein